jgi:hypothetical protein
VSAPIHDRFRDRFQIEIGGRWQLMPGRNESWRQWAFDPFFGVTRIGQEISPNPRRHLPDDGPDLRFMLDERDDGIDEATGLRKRTWISRIFWLRFGCRVLGLDLGFGVYLRRRADDKFTRDSGSGPSGLRPEGAQCEAPQSGDSEAGASPNPSGPHTLLEDEE